MAFPFGYNIDALHPLLGLQLLSIQLVMLPFLLLGLLCLRPCYPHILRLEGLNPHLPQCIRVGIGHDLVVSIYNV